MTDSKTTTPTNPRDIPNYTGQRQTNLGLKRSYIPKSESHTAPNKQFRTDGESPTEAICLLYRKLPTELKNLTLDYLGPTIHTASLAFAVKSAKGEVSAWGNATSGGSIPKAVRTKLKSSPALSVHATNYAFAAKLGDGRVVTWGDKNAGGYIPPEVENKLREVDTVYSFEYCFAAVIYEESLDKSTIIFWGYHWYSDLPANWEIELRGKVDTICSNMYAFAAKLDDGRVVAWGDDEFGAIIPPDTLIRIKEGKVATLHATIGAFAAKLNDGTVETWGHKDYGAITTPEVREQLTSGDVVSIHASEQAFAAKFKDGKVIAWGHQNEGGGIPQDIQLQITKNGVDTLITKGPGFIAKLGDNSVVSWGIRNWNSHMDITIPLDIQNELKGSKLKGADVIIHATLADLVGGFAVAVNRGGKSKVIFVGYRWFVKELGFEVDGLYSNDQSLVVTGNKGRAVVMMRIVGKGEFCGDMKIPDEVQAKVRRTRLVEVYPTALAFVGVLADRSIVHWGI